MKLKVKFRDGSTNVSIVYYCLVCTEDKKIYAEYNDGVMLEVDLKDVDKVIVDGEVVYMYEDWN